ncbi:RHS repeat-associated core domain-containing protein [Pseudomonas sp. OA65]|uniref:RHS repeat-associated core domain-containing protein n=1 Tax=Pseudomonas sp. OA65 TaxID=2818431 RepID=UPI001A9F8503|nr:RHS repeat-associated core domain-containing protein [Pseudomonas sp. OA65]MBO1540440.1 RHS repeat-associated core domain-containing protein [Pseudomonas sp. OA65]
MTHAPVQRFYCKSRLATEIEGAISRSIVQHGDQLLAQTETQGSAKQATLLATDQQRSVLHAVSANERQSHAYSPYGNRTIDNGLLSLLGSNGERPDPVTGHYLLGNGYRAFNPVLMRFNSPDSLSPFGEGGLNPYAYCIGDPINRRDPTGHIPIPAKILSQHRELATLLRIKKNLLSIKKPSRLKAESVVKKTRKEQQELISEVKILQEALPDTLKIGSKPTKHKTAADGYFSHQPNIPFDEQGVPAPQKAYTETDASGATGLSTVFFDDPIDFFRKQALKTDTPGSKNEAFRDVMLAKASEAIERKDQYIRKHLIGTANLRR